MRKIYSGPRLLGCLLAINVLVLPVVNGQNSYVYGRNSTTPPKHKATAPQDTNIEKQSLISVLKELNKTKGIYFLFSEQSLGARMVNVVSDTTASTEKILEAILKDTGLKFKKVNEKTFVIQQDKDRSGLNYNNINYENADPATGDKTGATTADPVTGKVTGSDGAPLANVSITVKGTSKGTSTNSSGVFMLQGR